MHRYQHVWSAGGQDRSGVTADGPNTTSATVLSDMQALVCGPKTFVWIAHSGLAHGDTATDAAVPGDGPHW